MTRRKSIIGALALCALSLCAFGAANASALGMTAVKCVNVGEGKGAYNNSACTTPKSPGAFETQQIVGSTPIHGRATTSSHVLGSTNSPVAVFKATVGGIAIEVTCGSATVTGGKVTNTEVEGRMAAHGTEGRIHYTECHASKQTDTTAICDVSQGAEGEKGTITTNPITTTTIGTEHTVEIKAETPETFVEFNILKGAAPCFTTGANLPVKVTGAVNATANTETHSHLTLTPATNGPKFKANGGTATYESTQDFYMEVGKENEKVGLETF